MRSSRGEDDWFDNESQGCEIETSGDLCGTTLSETRLLLAIGLLVGSSGIDHASSAVRIRLHWQTITGQEGEPAEKRVRPHLGGVDYVNGV